MARWQVRLADSAYEDVINGKIEKAEAWAATEAETTPQLRRLLGHPAFRIWQNWPARVELLGRVRGNW